MTLVAESRTVVLSRSKNIKPYCLRTLRDKYVKTDPGDDSMLEIFADAAVEQFETDTTRTLINGSFRDDFDEAPVGDCVVLARTPLVSVEAITYLDAEGALQTFDSSNYTVDTVREAVFLNADSVWPIVQANTRNVFMIEYTAGHGTTVDDIPRGAQLAIYLFTSANHYQCAGDDKWRMAYDHQVARLRKGFYP